MTAKLGSLAVTAAQAFGVTLDAPARGALALWFARLAEWNARMDLTAARNDEELVDLLLADALALAPRLAAGAGLVDVGTGAGAPGLALAILRSDLRVTLVEPRGKRASFLRTVIGELGRKDIALERARGEALPQHRWDVAVARATLPPAAWLDLGSRLVAPGGTVWVLVAHEAPPLHREATLQTDFSYTWPLTGARRRALAYRAAR